MSILSNNLLIDHVYPKLIEKLKEILNPLNQNPTIGNYTDLIQSIDEITRETALQLIKDFLESMDEKFFASQSRKNSYFVKSKRDRTLITVFGQLTFTRRIYQSKTEHSYYIHVDRKMGLPKYDRYDPTVKAKIVELYADQNSMIKVGEIIGETIYATFSRNEERKNFNISRQTVYNIVRKAPKLLPNIDRQKTTPKMLYIMADEKYVPLQKEDKKNAMLKQIVLFETVIEDHKRTSLQKKLVFSRLKGNIWEDFHDYIAQVYNLEQVEKIIVMGDGAHWIKNGRYELPNTQFILDLFHAFQSVTHMTVDEEIRKDLRKSIFENDTDEFEKIVKSLKYEFTGDDQRLETIDQKYEYLSNNWNPIQRGLLEGMPGCSMEAQISHNLAAVYTSRPKSYKTRNLETYLYYRDLHLNNVDILNAYLHTFERDHLDQPDYIEKEVIDLSFFDPRPRYDKSSTSNWLKGFISRH